MKLRIGMKTPDAVEYALNDARDELLQRNIMGDALDAELDKIMELTNTWFKYGECCTLEVDTEAKTCIVVPR